MRLFNASRLCLLYTSLAALHLGVLGALGLDGHIAAVILADEVLECHVHAAGVALEFAAVKIVAYGNEAGMEQWEHTLDEVAGFNAVTPEMCIRDRWTALFVI